MKLETLSHRELISLRDRIGPALAKARSREAADLRDRITSMVTQAGLSVRDVIGNTSKSTKPTKAQSFKVRPAKYKNPENSTQTWGGRGRPPLWLTNKCKTTGATRDQFAV